MIIEIRIPEIGESISFVQIARWLVKNGDVVDKDQEIAEIDSDKATLSLTTDHAGTITILVAEEVKTAVGDIVCTIDTEKAATGIKEQTKSNVDIPSTVKSVVATTAVIAESDDHKVQITPVAQNMIREQQLDPNEIIRDKF